MIGIVISLLSTGVILYMIAILMYYGTGDILTIEEFARIYIIVFLFDLSMNVISSIGKKNVQ